MAMVGRLALLLALFVALTAEGNHSRRRMLGLAAQPLPPQMTDPASQLAVLLAEDPAFKPLLARRPPVWRELLAHSIVLLEHRNPRTAPARSAQIDTETELRQRWPLSPWATTAPTVASFPTLPMLPSWPVWLTPRWPRALTPHWPAWLSQLWFELAIRLVALGQWPVWAMPTAPSDPDWVTSWIITIGLAVSLFASATALLIAMLLVARSLLGLSRWLATRGFDRLFTPTAQPTAGAQAPAPFAQDPVTPARQQRCLSLRQLFNEALQELAAAKVIQLTPATTHGAVEQQLDDPSLRAYYHDLCCLFERCWYGEYVPDTREFEYAQQLAERLRPRSQA
jgi:hypothetical protein